MFQINLGLSLLAKALIHQLRPTMCAPDAGDCPKGVRTSQAVSPALAFFQLDGFAVPALVIELVKTQRR